MWVDRLTKTQTYRQKTHTDMLIATLYIPPEGLVTMHEQMGLIKTKKTYKKQNLSLNQQQTAHMCVHITVHNCSTQHTI